MFCRPHSTRHNRTALFQEKAKEKSVSDSHIFLFHVFLLSACISIERQGLAAKVIDRILGWQPPCFPSVAEAVLSPFPRDEMVMRVPHFLPGLLPISQKNVEVFVASELVDDPTDPFHGDSQGSGNCILALFHSSDVVFRDEQGVEVGEGVDV